MLRPHLSTLATLVSPLIAFGLVLPPVALAGPEAPVASETLVTSNSPPPPTQVQGQGSTDLSQSQSSGQERQAQQVSVVPQNQTQTYQGPGITMQPTIQVSVQPQIQISAQPHAEANPTTTSNSNSNSNANATADADTKSDSQSQSQSSADSDIKVAQPAPRAVATAPTRTVTTAPTRIRVRTRVIPGTAAPARPIYPYKPPSRRKGLMIAGWTILGASYIPTAFTGAQIYDWCTNNKSGSDRRECRDLGTMLMIPVAGPFMAINEVDNATEGYFLALTGAVQTMGFLMGVIGTGQYIRDGRRNDRINAQGIRVAKGLRIGAGSMTYNW